MEGGGRGRREVEGGGRGRRRRREVEEGGRGRRWREEGEGGGGKRGNCVGVRRRGREEGEERERGRGELPWNSYLVMVWSRQATFTDVQYYLCEVWREECEVCEGESEV